MTIGLKFQIPTLSSPHTLPEFPGHLITRAIRAYLTQPMSDPFNQTANLYNQIQS